jgi:hypothetical protein
MAKFGRKANILSISGILALVLLENTEDFLDPIIAKFQTNSIDRGRKYEIFLHNEVTSRRQQLMALASTQGDRA